MGRERTENQDAFGELSTPDIDFWFVCDGLGGHKGGSTASTLGVDTLIEVLAAHPELPIPDRMTRAIEEANTRIGTMASQRRELRGMGTTVVMLAVDKVQQLAWFAHVGDSRGYLLRGAELRQLTRDHTMVQRLVDDGIIPPEAAANHPNSNVISRSLGGREDVEVELIAEPVALQGGDTFLLCSDGLYGPVSDPVIARLMADLEPSEASSQAIDRANEGGGSDNITVVVVRWGEPVAHPEEIAIIKPARPERPVRPAPEPLNEETPVEGTPRLSLSKADAPAEPAPAPVGMAAPEQPPAPAPSLAMTPEDRTLAMLVAAAAVLAVVLYLVIGMPEPPGSGVHGPNGPQASAAP